MSIRKAVEPYFVHAARHANFTVMAQIFPMTHAEYGIMQFDRPPLSSLSFIYANGIERRRSSECETPRNWLLV